MYSNDESDFFISTISDKPEDIFENIGTFNRYPLKGFHFDVMDGLFVPRIGLYPELLGAIRRNTKKFIEVHLMITCPSIILNQLASLGANRVLIHVETKEDIRDLYLQTKELGMEFGLVVNPETSISRIEPILNLADLVMLMGIRPGIPKHPFIPETIGRIRNIKELLNQQNLDLPLSIDGGITFLNLPHLKTEGIKSFVLGSGTVFSGESSLEASLNRLFSKNT